MSDRLIQPESQPITGPSSSNDDVLVNDIKCVKHGWAMREKGQEVQITYRQTKPGELLHILCENDNDHMVVTYERSQVVRRTWYDFTKIYTIALRSSKFAFFSRDHGLVWLRHKIIYSAFGQLQMFQFMHAL